MKVDEISRNQWFDHYSNAGKNHIESLLFTCKFMQYLTRKFYIKCLNIVNNLSPLLRYPRHSQNDGSHALSVKVDQLRNTIEKKWINSTVVCNFSTKFLFQIFDFHHWIRFNTSFECGLIVLRLPVCRTAIPPSVPYETLPGFFGDDLGLIFNWLKATIEQVKLPNCRV